MTRQEDVGMRSGNSYLGLPKEPQVLISEETEWQWTYTKMSTSKTENIMTFTPVTDAQKTELKVRRAEHFSIIMIRLRGEHQDISKERPCEDKSGIRSRAPYDLYECCTTTAVIDSANDTRFVMAYNWISNDRVKPSINDTQLLSTTN